MKVLCPATRRKRKLNGCDAKCDHFLPHERVKDSLETMSCKVIRNDLGYVICPACVKTTPEMVKKATVEALVQKMTRTIDYEDDDED